MSRQLSYFAAAALAGLVLSLASAGCEKADRLSPPPADGPRSAEPIRPIERGRVDIKVGPVGADVEAERDRAQRKVDVKVKGGRVDVDVKRDAQP